MGRSNDEEYISWTSFPSESCGINHNESLLYYIAQGVLLLSPLVFRVL